MRGAQVFAPTGAHTVNSSLAAAVTLTPPKGAEFLMMQALAQNIRFTLDGTTPTATVGFQLFAGDTVTIPMSENQVVKVIQEAATATLQYQWGIGSW